MRTTVGQLLVNDALPPGLRDYARTLDKSAINNLLSRIAQESPEQYRDISHKLMLAGGDAAYTSGGLSFGLQHLARTETGKKVRAQLEADFNRLLDNDELTDEQREKATLELVGKVAKDLPKQVLDEAVKAGNPLALQVRSGAKGSPHNLATLLASDMLYVDHRERVLPIPVLNSYSEGLTPLEYWAGAYGARKGVVDTKLRVADAGALSKQLAQSVHRGLVTGLDSDGPAETLRGLPVDTDDPDSAGALLAQDVGPYKRNTVITPKILEDLRQQGAKRILVRSPLAMGAPDGGLYARDVGLREFGRLPWRGENVSMTAAQALSEGLTQGSLSSKHSGGVAGASAATAVSGFKYIEQLLQVPSTFKGGAAHAQHDGVVRKIEPAPAGGTFVWVDDKRHYVGPGFNVKVEKNQQVEAGDVLSDGIANPAEIVQHKGVGAGRRYLVQALQEAYRGAGMKADRRNAELVARGVINHVRLTDEAGDYGPDDVVPYSVLEHTYRPRPGFHQLQPKAAVGKYLERPYLHYSIGTKIRPSMLKDFEDFGVQDVSVHDEPPPFQPEMVRIMDNLQHDPDWMVRMFGSGLKKGLQKGTQLGATSDTKGTSFVPGLASGTDFGRVGKVISPKPFADAKP